MYSPHKLKKSPKTEPISQRKLNHPPKLEQKNFSLVSMKAEVLQEMNKNQLYLHSEISVIDENGKNGNEYLYSVSDKINTEQNELDFLKQEVLLSSKKKPSVSPHEVRPKGHYFNPFKFKGSVYDKPSPFASVTMKERQSHVQKQNSLMNYTSNHEQKYQTNEERVIISNGYQKNKEKIHSQKNLQINLTSLNKPSKSPLKTTSKYSDRVAGQTFLKYNSLDKEKLVPKQQLRIDKSNKIGNKGSISERLKTNIKKEPTKTEKIQKFLDADSLDEQLIERHNQIQKLKNQIKLLEKETVQLQRQKKKSPLQSLQQF